MLMPRVFLFCLVSISAAACFAAAAPVRMEFTIDGVEREPRYSTRRSRQGTAAARPGVPRSWRIDADGSVLVRLPDPVARSHRGLPAGTSDPDQADGSGGEETGWQWEAGQHGDRDLAFFDAVLAAMKKTGRVDERRIYAAGHSNGGIFVYLLWAVRGDVFAAFATSCSMAATGTCIRG